MKVGIRKLFLIILCAAIITTQMPTDDVFSATVGCNYYASPTGGGNGISDSNPFKIGDFWQVAKAGDVLCLLDGKYTGANSMIDPPAGLNGTQAQPITIKAINDGAVEIDGESVRTPVHLGNNDWFIIEGMDVHSSANDGNGNGSVVYIGGGADNNIVRRVCGWDAPTDMNSSTIFDTNKNINNTFEDVCGFGNARKIFAAFRSKGTTYRRAWGQWENMPTSPPKLTFSAAYHTETLTAENLITTWDDTISPLGPTNKIGLIGADGQDGLASGGFADDYCTNSRVLGSVGYMKNPNSQRGGWAGALFGSRATDCIRYKDILIYLEPGGNFDSDVRVQMQKFDGGQACSLGPNLCDCPSDNGGPNCDRSLSNSTFIGTGAVSISSGNNGWQTANNEDVTTVAAATSIWNGGGTTGARLCFQYIDGQLTTTKLWPWPMDARIRQALTRAGKSPDVIFGGVGNGVTELMESMFGTIPAECKASISAPASPSNLIVNQ